MSHNPFSPDPYELAIRGTNRIIANKGCLMPIIRRERVSLDLNPLAIWLGTAPSVYQYTISLPCHNEQGKPWEAKLWYEDTTGKHLVDGHKGMLQLTWIAAKPSALPPIQYPLPLWPIWNKGIIPIIPRPDDPPEWDGFLYGSLMFDWLFYARDHEIKHKMFASPPIRARDRIDPDYTPVDGVFTLEWRAELSSPVVKAMCKGHTNPNEYNRHSRDRDTLARFRIHDIQGYEALVDLIDNPLDPKWNFES